VGALVRGEPGRSYWGKLKIRKKIILAGLNETHSGENDVPLIGETVAFAFSILVMARFVSTGIS
jgi:hypothetical protein